jgi:hypothetical protein
VSGLPVAIASSSYLFALALSGFLGGFFAIAGTSTRSAATGVTPPRMQGG